MRTVVVVVAHPRRDSLTWAVAELLLARARTVGAGVVLHDLYADGFDPLLTAEESRQVQLGIPGPAGDPLTARYRDDLVGADVLLALHPNWWGKPPAAMSGWLDRVLAPGVAYKLQGGSAGEPEALLRLDALVVTFGDTPSDREAAEFGDPLQAIWTRCVLPYVGAGHIERRHVSPVGNLTAEEREREAEACWTSFAALLGRPDPPPAADGPWGLHLRLGGYRPAMTDASNAEETSARREAVQGVVDRVSAWQHSATDGTVTEELRQGLTEAGVELDDSEVAALAEAIEADDGPVDAARVV